MRAEYKPATPPLPHLPLPLTPSPILHQHVERLQPDSALFLPLLLLLLPLPPPPPLSFIHEHHRCQGQGGGGDRSRYKNPVSPSCHAYKSQHLHTYKVFSWQQQWRELTLLLPPANHGLPQPPPPPIGWGCQQSGSRAAAAGQWTPREEKNPEHSTETGALKGQSVT